jgi:LPXTG-motif cell wall-anchored protein
MRSKSLLTLAALGAAVLTVSAAPAYAQNDDTMNDTIMDAGLFRENLSDLREVMSDIQENSNLALASQDPLVRSQYENDNRRMLNRALGIIQRVNMNWKTAEIPSRFEGTEGRFGSADRTRYAAESADTAFVRNTLWDLQSKLEAAKLNGRTVVITNEMMSMLDEAIRRAENPDFRFAQLRTREFSTLEWSRSEASATPAAVEETTTTREVSRVIVPDINLQHPEIERTQVAQADTTMDTTTEETIMTEETELPQTGGAPGLLVLLGSGLAGLGALIRRRS